MKFEAAVLAALLTLTGVADAAQLFTYRGAGCTGRPKMAAFEALVGRPADGIVEFAETSDWTHMRNSVDWAQGCWVGTHYALAQSVPMLMLTGSLADGARGDFDKEFVALGTLLVARGRGDAYLRIGWEFNGGWYRWAAAADPVSFKAYFRRIVAAFRSVPGQHFRIVWNPTHGQQQIAPDAVWPGDDVVDVVALDVYDQSWRPEDSDAGKRWSNIWWQPYGLKWLRDFAATHHKPIALPEWGTGTRSDGHGYGDDALFIDNMAQFIRDEHVVFHGYWDYPAEDFNAEISSGRQPHAAAAFRAAFGVRPARP